MLISSRRLYWGAIFVLTLMAATLFRPVRSWLDHAVVKQMVAANFSVDEVHFHAEHSIVELRRLDWQCATNSRNLTLSADRAWFVFESEPLLDRRILFPKTLIPDARIVLDDYQPPFESRPSIWEQRLSARLAEIDWREIGSHFNSLLSNSETSEAWQTRLKKWLFRSNQIADEATELEKKIEYFDNPLRIEDEIAAYLRHLQGLSREHAVLMEQIDGLRKLLDTRVTQMREKLQEGNQLIEQNATALCENPDALASVAQDLLQEAAAKHWNKTSEFAEVADRLARATCDAANVPRAANNVNVRMVKNPLIAFSDLEAHGSFAYGSLETPFDLQGELECSQLDAHRSVMTCLLNMNFATPDSDLSVQVCNRTNQPSITDIQLTRETELESQLGVMHEVAPFVMLASAGDRLEGSLTIASKDLELKFDIDPSSMVQMRVAGNWQTPEFELEGSLPSWLLDAARKCIETEIFEAQVAAQQEMQAAFDAHLASNQNVIETSIRSGEEIVQQHQDVLATATAKLQQRLNEAQGVEFARRPREYGGSLNR
jgi:hypothetical protein